MLKAAQRRRFLTRRVFRFKGKLSLPQGQSAPWRVAVSAAQRPGSILLLPQSFQVRFCQLSLTARFSGVKGSRTQRGTVSTVSPVSTKLLKQFLLLPDVDHPAEAGC
jgi:hypothetical protein